jgi:hypothetical protein
MQPTRGRGILIAGGVCGILWPILSVGFYAAYPLVAGGAMHSGAGDPAAFAARAAELGQRPAVVGLEWANAAFPLLLWPYYLALRRLLKGRGEGRLAAGAFGLGLVGMGLMVVSGLITPSLLHALGQACVEAEGKATAETLQQALEAVIYWAKAMNQVASLLYQGSVALVGVALIRTKVWRVRGWLGVVCAVLALPAKVPLGLRVPTNAIWTGLAYGVWPIAVGIGLLRCKEEKLA